jgi:hypothetical protein
MNLMYIEIRRIINDGANGISAKLYINFVLQQSKKLIRLCSMIIPRVGYWEKV